MKRNLCFLTGVAMMLAGFLLLPEHDVPVHSTAVMANPQVTLTPVAGPTLEQECNAAFHRATPHVEEIFDVDLSDVELVFDQPLPERVDAALKTLGVGAVAHTHKGKVNVNTKLIKKQLAHSHSATARWDILMSLMTHELGHAAQAKALGYPDLTEWSDASIKRLRKLGWTGEDEDLRAICNLMLEGQSYQLERELGMKVTFKDQKMMCALAQMMSQVAKVGHRKWLAALKADDSFDKIATDYSLSLAHQLGN